MQAIRRAQLQLGENFLVVGLGIVGQLALQIGKLSAGAEILVASPDKALGVVLIP